MGHDRFLNMVEFLAEIAERGERLWLEDGKLSYRARRAGGNQSIIQTIQAHKEEIIVWLRQREVVQQGSPLSQGQQGLWLAWQLSPHSSAYNVIMVLKLAATVDLAILQQAAQLLLDRHPILRTLYPVIDDTPVQEVCKGQPLAFALQDGETAEGRAWTPAQIDAWIASESDRPFDLAHGPLTRFNILRYSDQGQPALLLHWNTHHIVTDLFSQEMLAHQLQQIYHSLQQGDHLSLATSLTTSHTTMSPTESAPLTYWDFVRWEADTLRAQEEQLATYWQRELSGEQPPLNLPTDLARTTDSAARDRFQTLHFHIDEAVVTSLQRLAKENQTTLYTLLLTTFQALLARYTQQTEFLINSPTALRDLPCFAETIGYLVNPVLLRMDCAGDPTFLDLVKRTHQTVIGAMKHHLYPYAKVRRQINRQPTGRQIGNQSAGFIFDQLRQSSSTQPTRQQVGGFIEEVLRMEQQGMEDDLTLMFFMTNGRLSGRFVYQAQVFEAATIERMIGHLQILLTGIIANPNQPMLQLPMLTAAEYHQIVHEWNDTDVDFGEPQTIHALFEQQVASTPDAVAVVMDTGFRFQVSGFKPQPETLNGSAELAERLKPETLTYCELNTRANQLAHHLIALGVGGPLGADTLVAVMMERSVEMVVSLLAVLKAGGAYVPIDPTYPSERIAYMLTDSAAPILLTQSHLSSHLSSHPSVDHAVKHVINVDTIGVQLAAQPSYNPQTRTSPEHLAYVIYTSGSTGQPKGVTIPHHNLFNLVLDNIQTFALSPDACIMHAPTFGFDVEVGDLFMTLCSGARLYLPAPGKLIGHFLHDQLKQSQATHVSLTPTALSTLPVEPYPHLHTMIVAGEALPDRLAHIWLPFTSVWNAYGPTENTIYTTATLCQIGNKVHIGKPLSNVKTLILDNAYNLVPIGVAGDFYNGGTQLARGYLNRPDLTAERFIEHPAFGRLYKTGDLCRWLPDGNIEYLGRTDFQVKIRGFRIELGEIENALLAQDGVREAVVLAREDNPGDKRLVAYLVGEADTDTLRQQLAQRLPDYMIPSAFVVLEKMPLTPNGKLDRRALPAPDYADAQTTFVAPRNAVEVTLVQAFTEILRIPQISIHDNFFRMGGDSILSIQVVNRVAQYGYSLSVKNLFQHPTVAQLATVIHTAQPQVSASQEVQLGRAPLLPIQRWFLTMNQAEMHHFNQSFLLTVKEPIEQHQLEAALHTLLYHHDALRFQYGQDEIGWYQAYLLVGDTIPLTVVDLQAVAPAARAAQIEAIGNQSQASLNPLTGDLVRFVYFKTGGDDRLLLVIHHLAVDGVSWRILIEDLTTLLAGGQLPPKTSSYRDWGERLQTATAQGDFDADIQHWLAETPDIAIQKSLVQRDLVKRPVRKLSKKEGN